MPKAPQFASTYEQKAFIRQEWQEFANRLDTAEPTATPRTWSFEIETPDADNIATALNRAYRAQTEDLTSIIGEQVNPRDLIAFCQDGSVERYDSDSDSCECECPSCTYHSCDCDHCDQQNEDPDHDCGYSACYGSTGDYQEIKPETYCEGTHPAHLALLDLAGLEDVEINDTCGLHIHLGSADLTARDVANIIRVYRSLSHILDPIAERAGTYYAQRNSADQATRLQFQGESTEKYFAVNTAPHFAGHRAQTVEFRQHAGTNDTKEIRAWAMLLMQIVEYAKTNRTTLWLEDSKTFGQAWEILTARK